MNGAGAGRGGGGYRDARVGIAQRIADAELAIADCDARITAALASMLPRELALRIAQLRDEPAAVDDSIAELTRVADARETFATALRQAIALAPELEAHLQGPEPPPPAPPQEDMWGPIGTEEAIVPTLESARAIAKKLDHEAVVTCTGPRITCRMHVNGVPLLWCIEMHMHVNMSRGFAPGIKFLVAQHLLEMRVSEDLPPMTIRPSSWAHSLLRVVHLAEDVRTMDEDFDRELTASGDAAFAAPLLSEEARAALLECANAGKFTLHLEAGLVTVKWREGLVDPSLDAPMPEAVAKALAHLHESAAHFSLVRPPEKR